MITVKRSLSSLQAVKTWVISKMDPRPMKVDLGLVRISPVDTPLRLSEQFIPLTRTTVVRKLSQDPAFVSKSNQVTFERLCRYLEACISNRHSSLLQKLKTVYEHLNPDTELTFEGYKSASLRRQILDDEFSLIQKLSRLMELANFTEMNKDQLEQWLTREGGMTVVQAWIESGQYDLIKVWLLGRDHNVKNTMNLKSIVAKYWPIQTTFSPFRQGYAFKRVVLAVRIKKSHKVHLKIFKDLSEGELIHILPQVNVSNSKFDNSVMVWTGGLFSVGIVTHLLLPAATVASWWLLTSTHQLASTLAGLSALVGLLQWNVIQQKKAQYWRWRSELNYESIIANNRGVVNLLAERAQEEIFKEAVLCYMTLLRHINTGISQSQLEAEVDTWALTNCDIPKKEDIKVDLTESLSLLRQLKIVVFDGSTHNVTAIPLQSAVTLLGSEFQVNNIMDTDGIASMPGESSEEVNSTISSPDESFEKLRLESHNKV